MAQVALRVGGTLIGSTIGAFLDGPIGAVEGAYIGYQIGNTIANSIPHHSSNTQNAGIQVQLSTYGQFINQEYGNMRCAGNVIWMQPIFQTSQTTSEGKGGAGKQSSTTYVYTVTLAIAICAGPIQGIGQVWADSELLSLADLVEASGSNTSYNIYLGTEDQLPDPIMESFDGVGNVPAYRGIAYVVIENFPLTNYGGTIPNFTFEIINVVRPRPDLEDEITSLALIPGYGECAYEDVIQHNVTNVTTDSSAVINLASVYTPNMNTVFDQADVLTTIDNTIFGTLENLEWVTVYVAWFADSLDAGSCIIVPKVEFQGNAETQPNPWAVGSWVRSTASVVNEQDDVPNYGGTPSDKSILDVCVRLTNDSQKVLLVPIILVDTNTPYAKPARWRITPANATDAANFFTKTNGYNAFIEHYANLEVGGLYLKDFVNAFSIGSGLGGLTSFVASSTYTCVNELVSLAGTVKTAMGADILITYAADWNEYHSDSSGTYNMDPLWASSNIDFVGVNAYFPLTPDLPQAQIDYQAIYNGWTSGEGWSYTWNTARTVQTPITAAQAWKNFPYWWENTHTNPGGGSTSWTAAMKPLWFTEIGFPSVDGCSNQPSVMVDPASYESAYPRASKGQVNNYAQRVALQASLDYLTAVNAVPGQSNLVPRAFVYGWDVRPYPQFPNLTDLWPDGALWQTGYWISGKVGQSNLGSIVSDLLKQAGVLAEGFDTSLLTNNVTGYLIDQIETARDAIQQLAQAYFFDMIESDGILKFIPRGQQPVLTIIDQNLMTPPASGGEGSGNKNIIRQTVKQTRTQELDLPNVYNLTYVSPDQQYQDNTQIAQRQVGNAANIINLSFDLALNDQDAKSIAAILLYNDWVARTAYEFSLPPQFAYLEPTDVIYLVINGVTRIARITESTMRLNGSQQIKAVSEDPDVYDFSLPAGVGNQFGIAPGTPPATIMGIYSMPALPGDLQTDAFQTFTATSYTPIWNGAFLYRSDDGGTDGGNTWNPIQAFTNQAIMGVAKTTLQPGSIWLIDNTNTVQVALYHGELSSTTLVNMLNGANAAMLGGEVIQFMTATLIDTGVYEISGLLRGRQGTDNYAIDDGAHVGGEAFFMIDATIVRVTMPLAYFNIIKDWMAVSVGNTIGQSVDMPYTYDGLELKPYAPIHTRGSRDGSDNLTITWVRRTRISGEWLDLVDVPLNEAYEEYEIDILNGSTVVRTITVTSPTASYTAAEQVTDFGSTQSSVSLNLYQISDIVGRGIARATSV